MLDCMNLMADKTCHCFVKHPLTAEERKVVADALHYARRVNDSLGITLALAQLTGKCPAKE